MIVMICNHTSLPHLLLLLHLLQMHSMVQSYTASTFTRSTNESDESDGWYNVVGMSACTDATFNGTRTIPFLGMANVSSECRALCEAFAGCTAYCGAGSTPHVSPTHQDWRERCYGRLDTKWKLTPMVDEYAGCNYNADPAGCPNPAAVNAVVVDVAACLQGKSKVRRPINPPLSKVQCSPYVPYHADVNIISVASWCTVKKEGPVPHSLPCWCWCFVKHQ